MSKRIGIIDADLLDRGTRFPNLSLMKIAGFHKSEGHTVELIDNYDELLLNNQNYDDIYLSKVFDFTKIPVDDFSQFKNLHIGGTGFFFDKAFDDEHKLPYEAEHHMPYYRLYDKFIEREIARGIKPNKFTDYQHYSIGFTTRGCIRQCPFCVNKSSTQVIRWSPVEEFHDHSLPKIYLWDDNILAFSGWESVLDELLATNKPFSFRQGMDVRLMTDAKAAKLCSGKYVGDYTFAFDNIKDTEYVMKGLDSWLKYAKKQTRLYVLCGFESQDAADIERTFERIRLLMQRQCIPYIMRHEFYEKSPYRGTYINLARWCNQPSFFKKKSYRQYCEINGDNSSTMRYLRQFEHDYPEIAAKYYDLRFDKFGEK